MRDNIMQQHLEKCKAVADTLDWLGLGWQALSIIYVCITYARSFVNYLFMATEISSTNESIQTVVFILMIIVLIKGYFSMYCTPYVMPAMPQYFVVSRDSRNIVISFRNHH